MVGPSHVPRAIKPLTDLSVSAMFSKPTQARQNMVGLNDGPTCHCPAYWSGGMTDPGIRHTRWNMVGNSNVPSCHMPLTYVEVDMECYWTVKVILTNAQRSSIWLSLLFKNTTCLPKHKSAIVLLYSKYILCISCHFRQLTLRMDRVKLLYFLTSLPVSHAILPCAVCFATSHPANHATCSYIKGSG